MAAVHDAIKSETPQAEATPASAALQEGAGDPALASSLPAGAALADSLPAQSAKAAPAGDAHRSSSAADGSTVTSASFKGDGGLDVKIAQIPSNSDENTPFCPYMGSALPADEKERVAAVCSLHIDPNKSDPRFDDITRLVGATNVSDDAACLVWCSSI